MLAVAAEFACGCVAEFAYNKDFFFYVFRSTAHFIVSLDVTALNHMQVCLHHILKIRVKKCFNPFSGAAKSARDDLYPVHALNTWHSAGTCHIRSSCLGGFIMEFGAYLSFQ